MESISTMKDPGINCNQLVILPANQFQCSKVLPLRAHSALARLAWLLDALTYFAFDHFSGITGTSTSIAFASLKVIITLASYLTKRHHDANGRRWPPVEGRGLSEPGSRDVFRPNIFVYEFLPQKNEADGGVK